MSCTTLLKSTDAFAENSPYEPFSVASMVSATVESKVWNLSTATKRPPRVQARQNMSPYRVLNSAWLPTEPLAVSVSRGSSILRSGSCEDAVIVMNSVDECTELFSTNPNLADAPAPNAAQP